MSLRQLAADRDTTLRIDGGEARQHAGEAARRLEGDDRDVGRFELSPERGALALPPRQPAEKPVALTGEAARDERRLDCRGTGEDGHGEPGGDGRVDQSCAGIVDERHAGVRDECDARALAKQAERLLCPARLAVPVDASELPCADPVTIEQDLCVPGVLAEDDVRLAQLVEDPQRHVVEVPDRRRTDRERHRVLSLPVERGEADEAGPDQARGGPELRRHDPDAVVRRLDRLTTSDLPRRVEEHVAGRCAEATADDDDFGVEDVDERADCRPEQAPHSCEHIDRTRFARTCACDQMVRVGAVPVEGRCSPVGSLPRRDAFEVPPPVTVPLAGRAVELDDDVPQLRPAAVQPVVDDDAAADARAEREHHEVVRAASGAEPPLGERGGVAVVLHADGTAEARAELRPQVDVVEREVRRAEQEARSSLEVPGHTDTDRHGVGRVEALDDVVDRSEHVVLGRRRGGALDGCRDAPVARDDAGENLRSTEVDSDHPGSVHGAATITARMPSQEKPYRRYKGGRVKGRVPLARHTSPPAAPPRAAPPPTTGPPPPRRRRRRRRWILVAIAAVLVAIVAWAVAGYLSFRSGVEQANERVPQSVLPLLTQQDGLLVSQPTTILVLGTDGGLSPGREASNRSDSIMLLRTDPGTGRLAFLSIPRDLRVEIPGVGASKINAAYQSGGATLALRTVKELTGLEVNHVAFVDFDRFKELIDAVGGIDVNVPAPIVSNRFDCPYATAAQCSEWPGWRFAKGKQHMDGRRALVYSRIRENRLDPSETDLDRARRQQQVVQATADRLTSLGGALRLPFAGGDILAPLATDLSATELLQLGWVYFRADASNALHCRLGGDPATVDGESVLLGSEDNVATVAMFSGRSAPLPPPKGLLYAPGCVVGDREL